MRLTDRIQYATPPDAPARSLIGSTSVTAPLLRTDLRAPVVIAPPLRVPDGSISTGAAAIPPLSRNVVLSQNGTYVTPEIFAID